MGVRKEAVDVGHEGFAGLVGAGIGEHKARHVVEAVACGGAVLRIAIASNIFDGLPVDCLPRRIEGQDELIVISGVNHVAYVVERGLFGHGESLC